MNENLLVTLLVILSIHFFCRVLYIDLKITSKFTSEFFKVPTEFTSNFVNFREKKRNDIKVIF